MTTRIELCGRLVRNPDLRVTPAGTEALRLAIACGEPIGELVLELVASGRAVPEFARQLRKGEQVRAVGALRLVPSSARHNQIGVEVVASVLEREVARPAGG